MAIFRIQETKSFGLTKNKAAYTFGKVTRGRTHGLTTFKDTLTTGVEQVITY